MAKQLIYVDDEAPGACGDVGMVYNGSDTLTSSKLYSGTSIELSGTLDVTGATSLSTLDVTGDAIVDGVTTFKDAVGFGSNIVLAPVGPYNIPLDKIITNVETDAISDLQASLNDGQAGQLKIVILGVNGGGQAVIAPDHFGNGNAIILTNSGDYALFAFDGTEWWAISHNGTII